MPVESMEGTKATYVVGAISYPGAWTLVGYTGEGTIATRGGTVANDAYYQYTQGKCWLSYAVPNKSINPVRFNYHQDINGNYQWGPPYRFAVALQGSSGGVGGFCYTAEHTGYVDIHFNDFGVYGTNSTWPVPANSRFGIFVNGRRVWPTADWYAFGDSYVKGTNVASSVNPLLPTALYVEEGDQIEFLFKTTTGSEYSGAGNLVDPVVCYRQIGEQEILPESVLMEEANKPVVKAGTSSTQNTNTITYPGAWDIISYKNVDVIADGNPSVFHSTYNVGPNYLCADVGLKEPTGWEETRLQWTQGGDWGPKFAIAVSYALSSDNGGSFGGVATGFRYTAEHTGMVDISLDKLCTPTSMGNSMNVRFAIFVGGEKIFPADDRDTANYTAADWYQLFEAHDKTADAAGAANAAIPRNVYVAKGQAIEFLFVCVSGDIWSGAGNVVEPRVQYTWLAEPDTTAEAALGADLALTISAETDGNEFFAQSQIPYALADSVKINVTCAAEENGALTVGPTVKNGSVSTCTVSGFAAKQMTEEVSYTVTASIKYPDGSVKENVVLKSGKTSIATYLKALVAATEAPAIKDMALATLHYGAEAQKYFGYKTDALANAGVTETVSFEMAAAVNEYNQTTIEGQTYCFSGASLLLNDTVELKLLVDAVDAPSAGYEGFYLQAEGSEKKVSLRTRAGSEDGSLLRVTISVPYSKFGEKMTFCVYDAAGNAVTGKITYSVSTYIARTAGVEEQQGVSTALLTLGQAVDAYVLAYGAATEAEIVARFAVLSDAHIGETLTNASPKLESALQQIEAYFGAAPDAIIFPGDYTNNGTDVEYKEFLRIMNEYVDPEETAVSVTIGNHEHYRNGYKTKANSTQEILDAFSAFQSWFSVGSAYADGKTNRVIFNGTETLDNVDSHIEVNNIHIIGIAERTCVGDYNTELEGYTTGEAYLLAEVKKAAEADPGMPILVYSHLANGSIKDSGQFSLSAAAKAELANYPQIIWISGHTHYAGQDPYMIQQGNYTNVQLGTSGSKWWWYYYSDVNKMPANYNLNDAKAASQGMFVTVDANGVVRMQRYDFNTGDPVSTEWVVDTSAVIESTENFTYTDDRALVAAKPVFAEGSKLSISNVTASSAMVTVPVAHIDDAVSDDTVPYYYIVVLDENKNIVYNKKELSHYYRGALEGETINITVKGLSAGETYTVMVVAESFYEKTSEALTVTLTATAS